MQGAGEGRELSITFQTSGKAVRLSAPDKWRKAVASEDLKPDTWVEIVRQGGSPQTVRADDVPELHALFIDLGLVSSAAPQAPADAVSEPAEQDAVPASVEKIAPQTAATLATGAATAMDEALQSRAPSPPTPPAVRNRRGIGSVIVTIIGVVIVANALRTCGQAMHHRDTSASSSQVSIVADSAAPVQSSATPPLATPADSSSQAAVDAGPPTPSTDAPVAEAAEGPSFDCSRVTSENLRLICATPDLAAADRTLAEAYRQALAASNDPAALRDSERAWIVARNAAPADVDQLRTLYAERIEVLRGQAAPARRPEPF